MILEGLICLAIWACKVAKEGKETHVEDPENTSFRDLRSTYFRETGLSKSFPKKYTHRKNFRKIMGR